MEAVVQIGSVLRKSACGTSLMVLPEEWAPAGAERQSIEAAASARSTAPCLKFPRDPPMVRLPGADVVRAAGSTLCVLRHARPGERAQDEVALYNAINELSSP